MPISNFPAALQPIIQQGFLARRFEQALRSRLGFRGVCDRVTIPNSVGETVTRTRAGLKPAAVTPIAANANTNLDNGLTASSWGVEQYTMAMNMYGSTDDLNMVTTRVGIASQFVQNAYTNGEQAMRSLDTLARNAIYAPYMGGQTSVTAVNGDVVSVDDIRGFQAAFVNGVSTGVNAGAPLSVTIGADTYQVVGYAADAVSTSKAPGGVSGSLTLSGAPAAGDSAVGTPVQSATASAVVRPNGRASTSSIVAGAYLTMATLLDAKEGLELNAVPRVDGFYNCFLDAGSARQLFRDPDFKQLFQGATAESAAFRAGELSDPFLGLRFVPTTNTIVQQAAGFVVRRPIVCGQGALMEGTFAGMTAHDVAPKNSIIEVIDGIAMVTREPLDRLGQIIAQSWYWIGGYCAPTDTTTNPTTVATATNAAYKRAVVIEHPG